METSGQRCTVAPPLDPADIVLCRVRGTDYLHLVKAIDGQGFQIGNNRSSTTFGHTSSFACDGGLRSCSMARSETGRSVFARASQWSTPTPVVSITEDSRSDPDSIRSAVV
ncbi:MAG: hypothetical protein CMO80_12320 [Verrucomicrobiales bacterium]|nr:hypothetical protein [Verrucomicrobiales bacterium]